MSQSFSYLKATLGIILVFLISLYQQGNTLVSSLIFAIVFGATAFLLHELMHYIVAKKLRYHAYFVSYDQMLLLSIAVSFMGVIFLAPGAVIVEHIRSRKDHGLIALAGPATNVVLGLFCLALSVYVHPFFLAGFVINSLLAFFNMLPILGLDGQAIWHWNKVVYVVSAVVVLGIYGFAMFGL